MNKFKCEKCGSDQLGYQKFVKSVTPIEITGDEIVRYLSSIIHEDDSLGVEFGFCCGKCGNLIFHRCAPIENEGELISYLSLSDEERKKQDDEYYEMVKAQNDYDEQDRREYEESICVPEDE